MKEEDIQGVCDLCSQAFGEAAPIEDVQEVYRLCKHNPAYHFIVGKCDGKVVAYTTMVIFYNLCDGFNAYATLWSVCVDENYRRQGVATQMFEELERIMEKSGVETVYFTSEMDNTGEHLFYRKQGYSDSLEKAFFKYRSGCQ